MKKLIFFIFLILVIYSLQYPEKVASLPEIMQPKIPQIEGDKLYITENATIYIYSLKDYSFIKKFGKKGEGPGEFMIAPTANLSVFPHKDKLIINSLKKLSFFTKEGEFVKEMKSKGIFSGRFQPLGDKFAGIGVELDDKSVFTTINIYDTQLNKIKEITRVIAQSRKSGKIEMLKRSFSFQTYKNKIIATGDTGFSINIFDDSGKLIQKITQKYKRRAFTKDDERDFRAYIKRQYKENYEQAKHLLVFPDTYPEIGGMFIDNDKIYAWTWKRKDKGEKKLVEFFIFNFKGKLLKKTFIPFAFQNELQPFPPIIKNNKLYQIIENFDEEEWELHITGLN
jgi:hypothetical protein